MMRKTRNMTPGRRIPKPRLRPTQAVVLAGGLGMRLRAVVSDRPKVLACVGGEPFLGYVLAYLADQEVADVLLCTGYRAGQIQAFVEDGRRWGLTVRYSEERTPLGTGGALREARERVSGAFFALNGDTLLTADLDALWVAHVWAQATATLALVRVPDGRARGCVALAEDGTVTNFHEKPPHSRGALVSGGVYVLEPRALDVIERGRAASIERDVFPVLAARGRLAGSVQHGYFADIGTPEALSAFECDMATGAAPVFGAYAGQKMGTDTVFLQERTVLATPR